MTPQTTETERRWPDVFIVGAPKCGTTSLYLTLKASGDFFCPDIKEPHYFTPEWPKAQVFNRESDYLALYRDARPDQSIVDATVHHLYSKTALARIAERVPHAKIIVLLRNPVMHVHSIHGHQLYTSMEDIRDFATVWRLQDERERGRSMPLDARTPDWLKLRKAADYGPQLRRLYDTFPREQVFVGILEDMRADRRAFIEALAAFLGRDSLRNVVLPHANPAKRWRSPLHRRMMKVTQRLYTRLRGRRFDRAVRNVSERLGVRPLQTLKRLALDISDHAPIEPDLYREIAAYFAPTVAETEAILGRALPAWRAVPEARSLDLAR